MTRPDPVLDAVGVAVRRLAVGGLHVWESQVPYELVWTRPETAARALDWLGMLALEVVASGQAEIRCGEERVLLDLVDPSTLEVTFDGIDGRDGNGPRLVPLGDERFQGRAIVLDDRGEELEIGKFTVVEWTVSGSVEVANDRSAAEFGICDTCFGMQQFRPTGVGRALISAHLGELEAQAIIEVQAPRA